MAFLDNFFMSSTPPRPQKLKLAKKRLKSGRRYRAPLAKILHPKCQSEVVVVNIFTAVLSINSWFVRDALRATVRKITKSVMFT